MPNKTLPSPEVLGQLLRYDPETGKLFWRERGIEWFKDGRQTASHSASRWNARFADKEALTANSGNGYLVGVIFGRALSAHRAAWALMYGEWPQAFVDHRDGNGCNNKASNLRAAVCAENNRNRRSAPKNTSGVYGVYRHKTSGLWCGQVKVNGRVAWQKYFKDLGEARTAIVMARDVLHGEFAAPS
jgi:HNH endonuclease